jgi:hypothetical protein
MLARMPAKKLVLRLLLSGVSTLLALPVAEIALRYHYRIPRESPADLAPKLAESERRSAPFPDQPFKRAQAAAVSGARL